MIIAAIGIDLRDEGIKLSRNLDHRAIGVSVLNVGGMDFAEEQTPAGVDQIGALASLDRKRPVKPAL